MNDDDHVPESESESGSAADARDDHVAALLAVEPLDELTRRRLVRNALEAAPATRRRASRVWWTGAAAAAVAAIVVTALVLTSGGSGDQTTAAREPTGDSATTLPATTLPATTLPATGTAPNDLSTQSSGDQAANPDTNTKSLAPSAFGASPASLGDLGDVTAPAALRSRAGNALRNEFSVLSPATTNGTTPASTRAGVPSAAAAPKGTGTTTGTAGGTIACSKALAKAQPGLGPVLAIGSATVHGKPATVIIATDASGSTVAVAITEAGCKVAKPVTVSP
jgi:hypothetical protein